MKGIIPKTVCFSKHFTRNVKSTPVVSFAILLLAWIQAWNLLADERSARANKAVIICVHGVLSDGDDSTYGSLKSLPDFTRNASSTIIVDFHWGYESFWNASQRIGDRYDQFGGISRYQWCAVAKLKNLVASLELNGTIDGDTKVSVFSHSQGTVVTLTALQEGMQIDHWVLMGSPLAQEVLQEGYDHTDFLNAARNVRGVIFNLNSPADDPAGLWNHIGRRGLPQVFRRASSQNKGPTASRWKVLSSVTPIEKRGEASDSQLVRVWPFGDRMALNDSFNGLVDVPLLGIDHAGKEGSLWGAGWWSMFWAKSEYASVWPESISWADMAGFLICDGSEKTFTEDQRNHCRVLAAVPINRDWNIFSDVSANTLADDAPWGGFGWRAEGRTFTRTFTISKGMETGFHFDDAKAVGFRIETLDGEVEHEMKVATWFSWEKVQEDTGKTRTVRSGQSIEGSWKSNGLTDKTVYLRIKGRSDSPARVKCTVTASPTKQAEKPFANDSSYANDAIQLNRSFQKGREPLSTKREREAADLFGSGMAESVRVNGDKAIALDGWQDSERRRWGRAALASTLQMVALPVDDVGSDPLLRSLEFIEPLSDGGLKAGSENSTTAYSRSANTYWDLLLTQKEDVENNFKDLRKQLEESKRNPAIPVEKLEGVKAVTFNIHAGLLELLRSRQLIREEWNEIIKSRNPSENLVDVVRLAPGQALANIATDRANLRLVKTWYSASPRLKERLSRVLEGQVDFLAFKKLLATKDVPPSLHPSAEDADATPPRATCDAEELVADFESGVEAKWLRTNRNVLTNGLAVLAAGINRESRSSAAASAIERFQTTGVSIKVPSDAFQNRRPHLEFVVSAVDDAKAQGVAKSLSCDLFLCLPNTVATSIERSGGYRPEVNAEQNADNKGAADRFEKVPMGLNLSGVRVTTEAWEALGKIIWLQEESRLRADLMAQRASLSDTTVRADLLSTVEAPELEDLAIQILSQGLVFQPEAGRAAGVWTDRSAPTKLLSRLGVPESLIGPIVSFDIDRKKLQWIELVVQTQVPFEEQVLNVPLRIDLSNGCIDEKALASALQKELIEKCIQKLNIAAGNRTEILELSKEVSLYIKDFDFSLEDKSRGLIVAFSATLHFVTPAAGIGTSKDLGYWKFQCSVVSGGSPNVLGKFKIPGTSFRLQLIRADMVGRSFSASAFTTTESFADQLSEMSENPDIEIVEDVRNSVVRDLTALKISKASLIPSSKGIQFTASIESINGRLPSSTISFSVNEVGTELPATALRFLQAALKRALLDRVASHLGNAQEQVLKKLAEELPARLLEIGAASLRIGKCEVAQHNSQSNAKALKIQSIEFLFPKAIAQEPVVVSNLWLVAGETSTVESLRGEQFEESVLKLLRSRTLRLDWKDASIQGPIKWKEGAKTTEVGGIRINLEAPEIVVSADDKGNDGIGVAVVAAIESDVFPVRLPRLRCLVKADSEVAVLQQEIGKERWEAISNVSEFAWSVAMTELSKAASDSLYGMKCDLLGLGDWTFNEEGETGRGLPCEFLKLTGGGLGVEVNGSFDVAGRPFFANVNLLTGKITWDSKATINALLSGILTDAVGLGIRVDNVYELRPTGKAKEVGWRFDILVKLGDELGEFKATGVKATTRGLKMPMSISWTSPSPLAVGPLVWLTKPSIRIPLDGSKRVAAQGNLTFPGPDMDKIAKVRCLMNIEVTEKGLQADATGTTIFYTFFPVYENRGDILIEKNRVFCELTAETVGVMKAIMTDNQRVVIDTGLGTLSAEGKFEVLGISLANAKLIYGQDSIGVPLAEGRRGSIWIEASFPLLGTRSECRVFIRDGFGAYDGYASTSVGKVLGVQVGKVEAELHQHHSRVKFTALGASLDIHGPGPNDLNGRWIEKEIKKLIDDGLRDLFDPSTLGKVAEQLLSGNVEIQVGGRLGGRPRKPGGKNAAGGSDGGQGGGGGDKEGGGGKRGDTGQGKDDSANGSRNGSKGGATGRRDEIPNEKRAPLRGEQKKREYADKTGDSIDHIRNEGWCYIKVKQPGNRVEIRYTKKEYQDEPIKWPTYEYLPKKHADAFNQCPIIYLGNVRYWILPRTDLDGEAFRVAVLGTWNGDVNNSYEPKNIGVHSISAKDVDLDTILEAQERPADIAAFGNDLSDAAALGSVETLRSFTKVEYYHILNRTSAFVNEVDWPQVDIVGFVKHAESGAPETYYLTRNWQARNPEGAYVAVINGLSGFESVRITSRGMPALHSVLIDSANLEGFRSLAGLLVRAGIGTKRINVYDIAQHSPKVISEFMFAITDSNLPDRLELMTISAEGNESRLVVHEKGIATSFGSTTLRQIPVSLTSRRVKEEFIEMAGKGEVDCFRQEQADVGGTRTFITVRNLTKDDWSIRVDVERENNGDKAEKPQFVSGAAISREFDEWKKSKLVIESRFPYAGLSTAESRTSLIKILLESRQEEGYLQEFRVNPLGLLNIKKNAVK
jgi:hypothetical protein